jgi:hypothetical protein
LKLAPQVIGDFAGDRRDALNAELLLQSYRLIGFQKAVDGGEGA